MKDRELPTTSPNANHHDSVKTNNAPLANENQTELFGISFCALSQKNLLAKVISLAEKPQASSVILANAHVVVEAAHNPLLKSALQKATMVIPDGVPVAWTLKRCGHPQTQRYSGPDLMIDIFAAQPTARHFFLGSTAQVLEKIKIRFTGNAVGFYSPPFIKDAFQESELQKQIELINKAKADYIWVGLGAPKQELYVTEMASRAQRGVWLAVGAAFDFYAQTKPRAPKFLQNMGLEWAFRLATEPRRLAGRYLKTNPMFVKMALTELFRRKNQ